MRLRPRHPRRLREGLRTLILGCLLWTIESGAPISLGLASDVGGGPNVMVPPRGSTVTVQPTEIDDILYNPGMGFADFHLGFGKPPLPPSQHPRPTVAYFRWSWADLEPAEGQYDYRDRARESQGGDSRIPHHDGQRHWIAAVAVGQRSGQRQDRRWRFPGLQQPHLP